MVSHAHLVVCGNDDDELVQPAICRSLRTAQIRDQTSVDNAGLARHGGHYLGRVGQLRQYPGVGERHSLVP
ncbi:hypothetical protein [Arthrobacter sp. CG_A4]|uniref:hypothetical protein n=1 Tax=Arthrobacter sp. CG_A4 TaxID=3071706 RepID=UPI002E0EF9BB